MPTYREQISEERPDEAKHGPSRRGRMPPPVRERHDHAHDESGHRRQVDAEQFKEDLPNDIEIHGQAPKVEFVRLRRCNRDKAQKEDAREKGGGVWRRASARRGQELLLLLGQLGLVFLHILGGRGVELVAAAAAADVVGFTHVGNGDVPVPPETMHSGLPVPTANDSPSFVVPTDHFFAKNGRPSAFTS